MLKPIQNSHSSLILLIQNIKLQPYLEKNLKKQKVRNINRLRIGKTKEAEFGETKLHRRRLLENKLEETPPSICIT